MSIVLRLVLILVPVIGLVFWIRWRARKKAGEEITDADTRRMQLGLIGLIVLLLVTAFAIRMADTGGSPTGRFVPAHVENGVTIPGHFVDDEAEEAPVVEDAEEDAEAGDETPS